MKVLKMHQLQMAITIFLRYLLSRGFYIWWLFGDWVRLIQAGKEIETVKEEAEARIRVTEYQKYAIVLFDLNNLKR